MKREATCSCGQLQAHCVGEPELVSLCHCVACQRRTSAPFGIGAFFLREIVEIVGIYENFIRLSDSGFGLVFHICAYCFSTVFWEPSRRPDMIAIGVGSFGDINFPAPGKEVYTECRYDWVQPLEPHSR